MAAGGAMPSWARSPWTTPRCSPAGCRPARWPCSRPPGSPPAEERAEHRAQRRARQPGLRPGAAERAEFYDRTEPESDRRVPAHPGHRARPPVPGGLVAARARAGLGAHVHPPGPRPAHRHRGRHRPGTVVRRRAPGPARPATPWRPAPRTRAPGPRSRPPDSAPDRRTDIPETIDAAPFTLFTGQWADLPLEEVARLASSWGYDGLELACWGDHFEVDRALGEDGYLAGRHALLEKYGLRCWAISNHLVGQAVCDLDRRTAPGDPPGPHLAGRRRRRGTAAGGGRDGRHRAGRRRVRGRHGGGLHRLVDLAHGGHVPALPRTR